LVQSPGFGLVEGTVHYDDRKRDAGRAGPEEATHGLVEFEAYFVLGEDYALPPAAAHEEQREDEEGPQHKGHHHAAETCSTGLRPGDVEFGLLNKVGRRLRQAGYWRWIDDEIDVVQMSDGSHLVAGEGICA